MIFAIWNRTALSDAFCSILLHDYYFPQATRNRLTDDDNIFSFKVSEIPGGSPIIPPKQ